MRKVQIQNLEHDASERDLVIIEEKDGKPVVHTVKPGRALLMEIEPKAFLAIGDHVPNGLLDAKQPEAEPTPENPQFTAEEQEALAKAGHPPAEPNRIPDLVPAPEATPPAASKAKKTKG